MKSAATAKDLPREGVPEVAMVGRSNVGKSSLINALVRQKIARTSAAPGKTRLANLYRVAHGTSRAFYLVDLPGYGYARGGARTALEFEELTRAYFGAAERKGISRGRPPAAASAVSGKGASDQGASDEGAPSPRAPVSALLLVDARHPGLDSDLEAWAWIRQVAQASALVATKIDKLSRGERSRALRDLESVFDDPAVPVSATTGEGLDELWRLIDWLTHPNRTARRPISGPV